jgi:uncharacterized protein involved in exopolysaccharide biosynthesis
MTTAFAPALPEDGQDLPPALPAEAPEPNPIGALARALRGRLRFACCTAPCLAVLGTGGYLSGTELYESQAILRVFPQESNILYATGDDSVLKTFDSFVKAETSYVASHPVMARALEILGEDHPDLAADITVSDLTGSIEIRRSDSLIVLTTRSREADFATDKLEAVVAAYMALTSETEEARSAVRLEELHTREIELVERLDVLRADQLEIGGEYGISAISRAHVEKIAQIDALDARLSEIGATLATLEASDGATSVDTSDTEIMRATLLDRTMADLGFERARLMSELAGLRAGYAGQSNPRFEQAERAKLEEIAVIEEALADRREQIRILGQTGALTDATAAGNDDNIEEIRSLYQRLEGQLEAARLEARELNRRRIELDRVEREIGESEDLLEETRRALEVIRLESGRALPGYTVLMSPPSEPLEPADDSSKMLAAAGVVGGAGFSLLLALGLGLSERRMRYAETLAPVEHKLPVLQVSAADDVDPDAADRLRNELQLQPLKRPRLVGKAPVIAVARGDHGETSEFARSLAESYARARMKTLLIEADLGRADDGRSLPGWSDVLVGETVSPVAAAETPGLWGLSAGTVGQLHDSAVSAPMVRAALDHYLRDFDAIIVSGGSLRDRLASQFVLSASDVGVLALRPSDSKAEILKQIDRFDTCLATAASRRCVTPCREIPGLPSEPESTHSPENRHEPDHPRPRRTAPCPREPRRQAHLRHRPERPAPPDDLACTPAHRTRGLGKLSGFGVLRTDPGWQERQNLRNDQVPVDVCRRRGPPR